MAFSIEAWLAAFSRKLQSAFGTRLLFLGLQGSWRRQEARPDSDIDVVTVLDRISLADLETYRNLAASMEGAYPLCGFLSGATELSAWPRHDAYQLYRDTRAIVGSLEGILPSFTREDIREAVSVGAANLYHGAVHAYLYEKEPAVLLPGLYKGAYFILRAKHELETGEVTATKAELLPRLTGEDRAILSRSMESVEESAALHKELIEWARALLVRYGK
jgi:hypothetical protein